MPLSLSLSLSFPRSSEENVGRRREFREIGWKVVNRKCSKVWTCFCAMVGMPGIELPWDFEAEVGWYLKYRESYEVQSWGMFNSCSVLVFFFLFFLFYYASPSPFPSPLLLLHHVTPVNTTGCKRNWKKLFTQKSNTISFREWNIRGKYGKTGKRESCSWKKNVWVIFGYLGISNRNTKFAKNFAIRDKFFRCRIQWNPGIFL